MFAHRTTLITAAFVAVSFASGAQTYDKEQGKLRLRTRSDPPHGTYLTDEKGMSLYLFAKDHNGVSTCAGDCIRSWPPLLEQGQPVLAGKGVTASRIGTVKRLDGTTQVTYGGWPLYYYYKDAKPGDPTGHDVKDQGAEWYLVSPPGRKVQTQKGS